MFKEKIMLNGTRVRCDNKKEADNLIKWLFENGYTFPFKNKNERAYNEYEFRKSYLVVVIYDPEPMEGYNKKHICLSQAPSDHTYEYKDIIR